MLKELMVVSGISVVLVIAMSVLAIAFNVNVLILTAVSFAILLWMMVLLYRRSRRAAPAVPPACHVAAALALVVGAGAVVGGAGHSEAVASLTLRESLYGPLQILRLTTGALLLFSGGMTLAMCPGIKAGRNESVGVGAATALLFWVYLLFTLPLPGTGGTVPPMFVMWSVYLLSLAAAAVSLRLGKFKARQPGKVLLTPCQAKNLRSYENGSGGWIRTRLKSGWSGFSSQLNSSGARADVDVGAQLSCHNVAF